MWQKFTFSTGFLTMSQSGVQNAANVMSFSETWFLVLEFQQKSPSMSLRPEMKCFFPVADLRPVSWRTCWRTWRVAASSSCLGASHQPEDQPPLRPPPPPLCHLLPLWTNKPSSATSCRWQTAAAAAAPPTSTEPSPPSALQVCLQQRVCFWLIKMFRIKQIFINERTWIPSSYLSLTKCPILCLRNKKKENVFFFPAGFNGARPGQPGRGAPPVRSTSLDSSMGPNPNAGRPFPPQHRNNGPYSLLQQQQQQGMMGTHPGMANQAAMANPGQYWWKYCCNSVFHTY